jgi:hypothetical protein
LLKIGQNSISSYDDDSSLRGQWCRHVYDQAVQSLLYQYPWTFASRFADLAKIPRTSNGESPEFQSKFSLPSDFLRLIAVYDHGGRELIPFTGAKPPYELISGCLLSDTEGCVIKYVFNLESVPHMSPLFIDCLVLEIALRMTKVFNDSGTYLQQLQQEFDLNFRKAKIEDFRQMPPRQIVSFPLLGETGTF